MSASLPPAAPWFGRIRALWIESQRGIGDVFLMLLPQSVIVLTGFLTTVLIARGLGPASLGRYSLVLSVAGLTTAFSDLGIGQTAIRYAARAVTAGRSAEHLAVLRWALRLRLVMVSAMALFVALAAPVIAGRFWHTPELTPLIRLGLLAGVFAAVASAPGVYFQSIRGFGRNALVQVGQALVSLAAVLLVAALGRWSVGAIVVASVVAAAIGALAFLPLVPRAALLSAAGAGRAGARGRSLWRSPIDPASMADDDAGPGAFAIYNLISTVVVMITLRLDVWLMGVFARPDQIGLYTVASRLALPMGLVLAAVSGALWPRASSRTDPRAALALLKRTFQLSIPLGLLAVLYALVVPLLTPWLFGSAYQSSRVLAQVLCLRYALAILIVPVGVVGYSLGLVRVYWIINLVQFVAVAVLDVTLLPRLGPMAAALALIVSEVLGVTLAGGALLMRARRIRKEALADQGVGSVG
jgi:O-antigen/teichoic acid export membrane protein